MKTNRYEIRMTCDLLHDILTGEWDKLPVISNFPDDAEIVGVLPDKYTPDLFVIIVSIPSQSYERQELDGLRPFRVEYEESR